MSTRRWRSVTSIALATAVALGWAAPAQAMTPRLITGPYVSGWFGYWEPDSVVQALADKGTSTVPEVNVFWWSFDSAERPLCTYNTDSTCSTTVLPVSFCASSCTLASACCNSISLPSGVCSTAKS